MLLYREMSASRKSKAGKPVPAQSELTQTGLFVLEYDTHRVLIGSPRDYEKLQESIRRHFPQIPQGHRVSYWTKSLAICEGEFTELSPDVWDAVIPLLAKLTVRSNPAKREAEEEDASSECDEGSETDVRPAKRQKASPPAPAATDVSQTKRILFYVDYEGSRLSFICQPNIRFSKIFDTLETTFNVYHERHGNPGFKLVFEGSRVQRDDTVATLGVGEGDTVHMILLQTGGKPVIYLMPPAGSEVEASVKLSLVSEWDFSAFYPVVPSTRSLTGGLGESLEWNVKTFPDGTLLEKNTGLEVSYLFWEAEALKLTDQGISSRSAATVGTAHAEETFIPTHPHIDANNAVVLKVATITPYLDSALKNLGLHTEARTSFITYWLPSILKHEYVALRFLPQAAYEKAAPLEVTPTPDVVVRIFMLFKGLKEADVDTHWSAAAAKADLGPSHWKGTVGLYGQSLTDDSLFRILEWGGMEIL